MKTYFLNAIKKMVLNNNYLDFTSTLKNQEWKVFNDDNSQVEKFFFLENNNLLVSVNGYSLYSKWNYIKVNASILLEDEKKKILFNIIACNKDILVLNIDSTKEYSFLINTKSTKLNNPTFTDIQWYLYKECGVDILNEKQRQQLIQEQREKEAERERINQESAIKEQENFKNISIGCLVALSIIACIIGIFVYKDYKKKNPTIYITKIENQIAVDLGLSVKWATCNVGANSPEEFGNYYGWGDPTGKDVYEHDSEPLTDIKKRFPNRTLNTPPPSSIVNSSYDIAKQNWGGRWRMPTIKEAEELLEKCTVELFKDKGHKLIKIIGPNRNYIIFPSAGFVSGTEGNWILKYHYYEVYLYTGEMKQGGWWLDPNKEAGYLLIGENYDKNLDVILEKGVRLIERYKMLPVRPVMDK